MLLMIEDPYPEDMADEGIPLPDPEARLETLDPIPETLE